MFLSTKSQIEALKEFNNCIKQWTVTPQAVTLWLPPNVCVQQQAFKPFIIIYTELSEQPGIGTVCLDSIYCSYNGVHWFAHPAS